MKTIDQLIQSHLCVLVLDRDSHNPIARMPIYAEISVIEELIPEELTEIDLGRAGRHDFFRHQRIGLILRSGIARHFSTDDFRQLDEETKQNFLEIIIDLVANEESLFERTDEEIKDIIDRIVIKAMEKLEIPESVNPTYKSTRSYPLGYLATDHVGYVSYDLSRYSHNALLISQNNSHPIKTDYAVFVYPMGKEGTRFNALDQGRITRDVVFAKLSIEQPMLNRDLKVLNLPSLQKPSLVDWYLSPGSFAANPNLLVGEDGCERIVPAQIALQEYNFRQVVRLVDTPVGINLSADFRFGYVDDYKVTWHSLGHSLGEILYSLPLAPGESVKLAVIDWSWASVTERNEQTKLTEELMHQTHRDRTITETVKAGLRELQRGSTFMAGAALSVGASGSIGVVGLAAGLAGSIGGATSTSSGSRDLAAENVQRLSDSFSQASSAQREINSTVVVQARQEEKESIQTRIFTNYNHSHTLTILYYEVLRHYKVVVEWMRRRSALLIKTPEKIEFNEDNIISYRHLLETNLLDFSLTPAFDLLEKQKTIKEYQTLNNIVPSDNPIPQFWEGDFEFSLFELGIKTTKDTAESVSPVVGYVVTADSLPGSEMEKKKYELHYIYHGGHIPEDANAWHNINSGHRFNDDATAWIFVKPFDYTTGEYVKIKWRDIAGFQFEKWGDDDWRIDFLTINAIGKNGLFINLTEGTRDVDLYFLGEEPSSNSFTWITRPTAPLALLPPIKSPEKSLSPEEYHLVKKLIAHFTTNREYYQRVIILNTDPNSIANKFEAIPWQGGGMLIDHAEPYPLEVFGDYVAYPFIGGNQLPDSLIKDLFDAIHSNDSERHKWVIDQLAGLSESDLEVFADRFAQLKAFAEKLITLPTRGVFAEGKLGHCNLSEEIDNTRFWKWEEHPLPFEAPGINPVTPITPQPQQTSVAPTPFPASLVNIVNPTAAPDPTGLSAALTLLGTPNIFRDMSGRQEVADLLKKLSDNSIKIAEAAGKAKEIQNKYGTDLAGIERDKEANTLKFLSDAVNASAKNKTHTTDDSPAKQKAELENDKNRLEIAQQYLPPKDQKVVRDAITPKLGNPQPKTKQKTFIFKAKDYQGMDVQFPIGVRVFDHKVREVGGSKKVYDGKFVRAASTEIKFNETDPLIEIQVDVEPLEIDFGLFKYKIPEIRLTTDKSVQLKDTQTYVQVIIRQASTKAEIEQETLEKAAEELANKYGAELGVDKVVAAKVLAEKATKTNIERSGKQLIKYTLPLPTNAFSIIVD